MHSKIDVSSVKAADDKWKGFGFNDASMKLAQLWEDSSVDLTLAYMRQLGIGNPKNQKHPFEVSVTKRIIDALTVVYAVPATRVLSIDGEELDDDDPFMGTLVSAFQRSAYDLLWQRIDAARNLFRTVCVEWAEDHANNCVGALVYGPHQIFRIPNPSTPHTLDTDKAILLQIRYSMYSADNLYKAWLNEDGVWKCWIVDETGSMSGEQPYGEEGVCPLQSLPLQLVHDEHPMFRAFLPIPESRISWALGINGTLNDLAYLVQSEAHSTKVYKTDSSQVPTTIGPGTIVKAPIDGGLEVLSNNPKIAESIEVLDQQLRLWALSEYLPGDTFDSSKTPHTGSALKVSQHSLAQRRWRQLQLVPTQEAKAWSIYVQLHNLYAAQWGSSVLPDIAELNVYPGRAWQPTDMRELQDLMMRDVAAGFVSRVDYIQERLGLTRAQAILHLKRVRKDAELFPPAEFQNPGALTDDAGPRAALGEDSATLDHEQFNPDIASSTEGASVVDAVASEPPLPS